MKIRFESSFEKDLRKIKDKKTLAKIKAIVLEIKQSNRLMDVNSLLKLRGYETFYRIRLGEYRIGMEVVNDEVIFARVRPSKDIYRYFP